MFWGGGSVCASGCGWVIYHFRMCALKLLTPQVQALTERLQAQQAEASTQLERQLSQQQEHNEAKQHHVYKQLVSHDF